MKNRKLTEKNMSNKRFLKTEQAIFVTYCKFRDCPSAKKLAKMAGVSRSTIHRHHQSAHSIPRNYEEFLLRSYTRAISSLLKKPRTPLKILFLRTFAFISNHGDTFTVLFSKGRKEIVGQILKKLKPRIISSWHHRNNLDQIFSIYEKEIIGVIELWSKHDFAASMLEDSLEKTLYLTQTAPKHLGPIAEPKKTKLE